MLGFCDVDFSVGLDVAEGVGGIDDLEVVEDSRVYTGPVRLRACLTRLVDIPVITIINIILSSTTFNNQLCVLLRELSSPTPYSQLRGQGRSL